MKITSTKRYKVDGLDQYSLGAVFCSLYWKFTGQMLNDPDHKLTRIIEEYLEDEEGMD